MREGMGLAVTTGEMSAWMMGAFRYRREVAAVEGWRSVEELIGWGLICPEFSGQRICG